MSDSGLSVTRAGSRDAGTVGWSSAFLLGTSSGELPVPIFLAPYRARTLVFKGTSLKLLSLLQRRTFDSLLQTVRTAAS